MRNIPTGQVTTGAAGGRRILALAAGALLFAVVATANAGGYRYGVSDQAFYVPAIELALDSSLFPRDRALLDPQRGLWIGETLLAGLAGVTGDLPTLFAIVQAATLLVLFGAAVWFARGLGGGWWVATTFVTLLTLRHQITRTGANTLEGYMHPRILAFAFGLASLGGLIRGRRLVAALLALAALLVHTTTGLWFAVVVGTAIAWELPRRMAVAAVLAAGAGVLVILLAVPSLSARLMPMDEAWLAVLSERTYLFPAGWPWYAWVLNLAYPFLLVLLYRRRLAAGAATPGETGLVAGLLLLVGIFLVSVPLTEWRIALAVQLQVNRIFWLLDVAVTGYAAWWLISGVKWRSRTLARRLVAAALIAVAVGRGYYVVSIEADRRLVELRLLQTGWTGAMTWLRSQPRSWHVLADPQHAWRHGSSVRVAALRDTLLEDGKDPALAIYDRAAALRVADRRLALANFEAFTTADVRALATRYDLDVFVDRGDRSFDLPVLYRNDEIIIYDLR